MTDADRLARKRYFTMAGLNLLGVVGAVFGLVLAGRAQDNVQAALGAGIVLAALYFMAVVPRALARRWKTPEA